MLGFPASGIECLMISGGAVTIIVEIKVHSKWNALESSWNYPPPPPPQPRSLEKLSSMKLVPGVKKVGNQGNGLECAWGCVLGGQGSFGGSNIWVETWMTILCQLYRVLILSIFKAIPQIQTQIEQRLIRKALLFHTFFFFELREVGKECW